jgi:hypothetical protein
MMHDEASKIAGIYILRSAKTNRTIDAAKNPLPITSESIEELYNNARVTRTPPMVASKAINFPICFIANWFPAF